MTTKGSIEEKVCAYIMCASPGESYGCYVVLDGLHAELFRDWAHVLAICAVEVMYGEGVELGVENVLLWMDNRGWLGNRLSGLSGKLRRTARAFDGNADGEVLAGYLLKERAREGGQDGA